MQCNKQPQTETTVGTNKVAVSRCCPAYGIAVVIMSAKLQEHGPISVEGLKSHSLTHGRGSSSPQGSEFLMFHPLIVMSHSCRLNLDSLHTVGDSRPVRKTQQDEGVCGHPRAGSRMPGRHGGCGCAQRPLRNLLLLSRALPNATC